MASTTQKDADVLAKAVEYLGAVEVAPGQNKRAEFLQRKIDGLCRDCGEFPAYKLCVRCLNCLEIQRSKRRGSRQVRLRAMADKVAALGRPALDCAVGRDEDGPLVLR